MNSLVSLVIPVYNVEQYLDDCLNSVVAQSYENLEIILVNDGSTDRSLNICNSWTAKDLRIKVVDQQNRGLSAARNTGVRESCGELIGFIDSDDFIEPNYIQRLVQVLDENPDCSIATCSYLMYEDGKLIPINKSCKFYGVRYIESDEWAERMLLMKSQHSAWGKLFKRELLDSVHFREGFLNEDILFCFDLISYVEAHSIRTVELSEALYFYRIRPDSICHGRKIEMVVAENRNMKIFMEATRDSRPLIYDHYYKAYLAKTLWLLNNYLNGMKSDIPIAELLKDLRGYSNDFVKGKVKDVKYKRFLFYKYLFPVAFVLYWIKNFIQS